MLKNLSVIAEGSSFNVDVHNEDIALIDMQSFREDEVVDVVEIVVSKDELQEIIRMLQYVENSME